MLIIPAEQTPSRDRASLERVFAQAHARAQTTGNPHLVSISLRVHHIAPLAVLQSVYEPNEPHAYFEHPQNDEATAAAEAICSTSAQGPKRFEAIRQWAQMWADQCICAGDTESPFAGPHVFCRFNFDAENAPKGYPAAQAFIPRWQVSRRAGEYWATANACIQPEDTIDLHLSKIWAAYQKFSAYAYEAPISQYPKSTSSSSDWEPLESADYPAQVAHALTAIRAGQLEKVVLASARDLSANKPLNIFNILDRLRVQYNGCFSYSWGDCLGGSFLGATPERLCRLIGSTLHSEALAGSAPRGKTVAEDAEFARALLSSAKDLREHTLVRNYIVQKLSALGINAQYKPSPQLRQLENVQHLATPIQARCEHPAHILDLAAALHPTPAIAGLPLDAARAWIRQAESFARGPYAGCLGWFNLHGEGELVVALRCACVRADQIRLFAGAGIVEGSDPATEDYEVELKLNALRNALF